MNLYLIPVRFSNSTLLSEILKELPLIFKTVYLPQISIEINDAFSRERSQYFSTRIIANAINATTELDGKVVILTELDLYIPVLTFVFGEAQLSGKHSVVSVCRLHEEFYTGISNEKLLLERTIKEILHELGHNFGLKHCDNWECVMHSSMNIEQVDIKGNSYCKVCRGKISI
jgi:archaemetzincin